MRTITLEAPGKNALGVDLMTTLLRQLEEAGDDAILLTGAGDAFSAGLNLLEVASFDAQSMEAFLRLLERVCVTRYTHPAPVVALVNGHAIAGGCVLAACADHRVMADNPRARIGLNEVALGLRFPPAILRICRARIPAHHHTAVFLGAGLHPPQQALALGLVDAVAGDAQTEAQQALEALARHPRAAYAATKHDLRPDPSASPEEERRFREEVLPVWTSPAVRDRILAVLKR